MEGRLPVSQIIQCLKQGYAGNPYVWASFGPGHGGFVMAQKPSVLATLEIFDPTMMIAANVINGYLYIGGDQ